jgi:hypothetical protein
MRALANQIDNERRSSETALLRAEEGLRKLIKMFASLEAEI